MNEEEKKVIEELSKKAVICNYEERDYPNMICFKKDMIIALNLIEKLQKENEELKEELETEQNERLLCHIREKQMIPVQKIKDKIEKLNQYYKKEIYPSLSQWRDLTITEHYDEMIELLQELLGDK